MDRLQAEGLDITAALDGARIRYPRLDLHRSVRVALAYLFGGAGGLLLAVVLLQSSAWVVLVSVLIGLLPGAWLHRRLGQHHNLETIEILDGMLRCRGQHASWSVRLDEIKDIDQRPDVVLLRLRGGMRVLPSVFQTHPALCTLLRFEQRRAAQAAESITTPPPPASLQRLR